MTQKTVKIIENNSKEILFETTQKNIDLAYKKVIEFEEMGLDVDIITPSVSQSLIMSLGASEKDVDELRKSELAEIESHNKPTCTEEIKPEIKH